jgi:hypothetical protein
MFLGHLSPNFNDILLLCGFFYSFFHLPFGVLIRFYLVSCKILLLTINKLIDNADTDVKKWYVVRAVSGQENKIKNYIESDIARLGFSDFVEEVLVPTEKVIQIRNGKKINKERNYFPGYIMIKANLSGEVPHIIRSITNVIGFLGETKGGEPVPFVLLK